MTGSGAGSGDAPSPAPAPAGVTGALAVAVRGTATTVGRATSAVAGSLRQVPGPAGRTGSIAVTSVGATAATLLDSVANGVTQAGPHGGGLAATLTAAPLSGH